MRKTFKNLMGLLLAAVSIGASAQTFQVQNLQVLGSTSLQTPVTVPSSLPGLTTNDLQIKAQQTVDVRDYGATCGVSDDTTLLQTVITKLGSTQVTLQFSCNEKISGNLTFAPTTTLKFLRGGEITGTTGSELVQVQSAIEAGLYQIFSTVTMQADVGQSAFPEWFGAKGDGSTDDTTAIQKAITFLVNVGGRVYFQPHTYLISAAINIGAMTNASTGQNTVLQGAGIHSTVIQSTDATSGAFQVLGANGFARQGIAINDMTINKTVQGTGGIGITGEYLAGFKVHNVQINNYLEGVYLLCAGNTLLDQVNVEFTTATITSNVRGVELDGGGTCTGGNASSILSQVNVGISVGTNSTGSIGFYAHGAYVSDLQFLSTETQNLQVGYELDMSTSANTGNEDVQLINPRADSIRTYGLYVNAAGASGSTDSMIHVIGGWFNAYNTGAEVDLIYLASSRGVTVADSQLYGTAAAANTYAIKMVSGINNKILGNTFSEFKYGVYMSGGRTNRVANNSFYSSVTNPATQEAVGIGEAYTAINENTFSGYATNGAVFDNTSTSCAMNSNNADPANITTRYSNSSVGTPSTSGNVGS